MSELAPRRAHGLLAHTLGPLWRTTFRDPVREGRLRLVGLTATERQAARIGLVTLVVLLGSTLLAGTWRRGELLRVADSEQQFVPATILGLTLAGFAVAWVAITWGGLRGSAPLRVLVGIGYALLNADFVVDLPGFGSDSWILQHHQVVQHVGYYAPVAALLVAGLTTRWPRLDRWVVRVGQVVCLVGTAMLFLGLLWAHAVLVEEGRDTTTPTMVGGSLLVIGVVLLPLVYVSAVAVIDFALDVSTSLTEPASGLGRRWLLVLVLGLVAAKLWFEVGARTDYWRTALAHQPQAVARTAVSVVLLGALTWWVTRFRRSEDTLAAKEDLTYGSSLVLAVPYLGQVLVFTVALVIATQLRDDRLPGWADDFPDNWLNTWGIFIASVLAAVVGIVLMVRSRGGMGDELGSGLVLIGSWGAVAGAVSNLGLDLGTSYPTIDVTITLGVLVLLVTGWRRLDTRLLLTAATVLVFSWLVTSRGDYISFFGGLVGLSVVVVVVFGIGWTLLSGSSFTSGSSRWLPQPARLLLFIGYVLLSVTILNWDEATHATTSDGDALVAYFYVGIPLAAYLLGRRVVRPPPSSADRP